MAQPLAGGDALRLNLARATFVVVLLAMAPAIATADARMEPPGRTEHATSGAFAGSAGSTIGVRTGDHEGFGRIVFDLPKGATIQTVSEGSRILLVFTGAAGVAQTDTLTRNLVGLESDGATATLTLSSGSHARQQRLGDRLVVDIFDPDGKQDADAGRKPALLAPTQRSQSRKTGSDLVGGPRPPPIGRSGAVPAPLIAPAAQEPIASPATASPGPAPVVPVQPTSLPSSEPDPATKPIAQLKVPPASKPALLLADTTVGAAAFRRGRWGVVVLDRRLKLAAPAELPGALVIEGVVSTVIQVPIEDGQALLVDRAPTGWVIGIGEPALPGALTPKPVAEEIAFEVLRAGRAVSVLDPATGGTLLVGTSLQASSDAAVPVERRTPSFTILPTWLGVAVEPLSDQVDLHAGSTGFLLDGGAAPIGSESAATESRYLDLPSEPLPALLNRLHAQLASAADAPPRARTQPRVAAIQAMLALGLGVEAQALAQKTIADDPEAASDARLTIAAAVAAVLSGRLDEASGLDKPDLTVEPELALWRGLRDRRLNRETENVRGLASHLAMVRAYPEPLRRRVWPDVAEAAAETGVQLPVDQTSAYAGALALEHAGKLDEAIAAWQALAAGADRRDQVRSTVHAIELQLAAGRIEPAEAADSMERQSYAWRGDGQELALRLRAAELRSAAGSWRAALDLLRATDVLFPDQHELIRAHKTAVFEAMMAADGARLSPLDVVMLASDYADCVPEGGKDARLARLLADKLMALDLPARAIPVLQGLVKSTQAGPARAEFGLRLGQSLFDGGDADGALVALQASDASSLSAQLAQNRGLLNAKSLAALGRLRDAAASLEAMHSAVADDLRAALLGQAGDWKGSLDALNALADKTLPSEGLLPPTGQSLVLREATAAVQARDPDQLRRINLFLPRMSGASADMLRILTQTAVTSTRELPRAANELQLAREIPKQIQRSALH